MLSRHRARLAVPMALALVAAAYAGSLRNGFTYDDYSVIVGNPFILSWSNLRDFLSLRYLEYSGELSYRPLVSLSYMADVQLWGMRLGGVRPFGFHLSNLLLHLLNVGLWWGVARRWLPPLPALIAAALWAVHPAMSEAVLAVAYREELLFTTFGLGLLILVAPPHHDAAPGLLRCLAAWALLALSLLSKEMALSLPLIVLLLVLLPMSSASPGERLRARLMLLAGLALCSALFLGLRFLVLRGPQEASIPPLSAGWWKGPLTMLTVVANDLRLFLLPVTLSADHDLQVLPRLFEGRLLVSLLVLGGMGWAAWKTRRARPLVATGMLWFGLALIPVLNIVPIANPSAERYLYFPFLGLSLAAGAAFEAARSSAWGTGPGRGMVALLLVALLTFVALTNQRGRVWRDNLSLWQATLASPSSKGRPYHNLADAWQSRADALRREAPRRRADSTPDKGRFMQAEFQAALRNARRFYAEALRRNPAGYESYNNLGNLNRRLRDYNRAVHAYLEALRLHRAYADGWNNLAITYKRLGYLDRAILTYLRTVALAPRYAVAYKNLGIALLDRGRRRRARRLFARSLLLNPLIEQHEMLRKMVRQPSR